MTLHDLAALVRDMRAAQKDYFLGRTPALLHAAKLHERRVDRALRDVLAPAPQRPLDGQREMF